MAELHPDLKKLSDFLQNMARQLIAKKAFFPTGGSLGNDGTLVLEYVQTDANAFETRKMLHAKLVQIARSGQALAVGLCHSLENPQLGTAIVISVDHIEASPATLIIPVDIDPSGEVQVRGEPMFQQAAYSFFRYVNAAEAQQFMVGTWKLKESQDVSSTEFKYSSDGTSASPAGKSTWKIVKGDFFSMLQENSPNGPRERRIVEMSASRVFLQEVVSGMVRQEEYSKIPGTGESAPQAPSDEAKPWWKFW